MRTLTPSIPLAALAGLLAACSGEGAGPSTGTQVTFHVATRAAGAAPFALVSAPDTQIAGADTLVFDKIELVLRDIRFERVDDDVCDDDHDDFDDDHGGLQPSHDDGGAEEDDDCEYFRTGPTLVDLPLGPGVERVFSVMVDNGTYDELRFKLHKPEDDSGDPEDIQFLTDHADFNGVSIRVQGSFNGAPFTYTSDLNEKQEQHFDRPLQITGGLTNVDVTLRVDIRNWFLDGVGGLADPATADKGGVNENLVRDNIRASFRAFRDDDRDGECDDDTHESDD